MAEDAAPMVDPNAVTTAPDHDAFTLIPVIRDILRTRYCVPGTVFLVEGVDIVPVSKTGRWQAVRLLLGDGELCVQALLAADCHRFVETGEVSTGFYVRLDNFDLEWESIDSEEELERNSKNRKMVFLALHDLTPIGWNEAYREMAAQHRESIAPMKSQGGDDTDIKQELPPLSQPEPETKKGAEDIAIKAEPTSSAYGDDFDLDDAFESMEKIVYPVSKSSTPKRGIISRPTDPVALPRDWADRRVPLKLTTLHAIPTLPYPQNWTCNVLAIVSSLSPVEASYLPPYKQRTARLVDPSTAKQVHLTVFLDPETFNPAVGSAVLLTGVKNHRFDGGSLKKYASDNKTGQQWWFEDPVDMSWCDVSGIKQWWQQMEGSLV